MAETKKAATFKAEVVAAFTDKYTDKVYKVGDTIRVTSERFHELNENKRHVKRI